MIKEAILKLAQRNDLTAEEALEVMNEIMDGKASPVQMSSYLTALSLKGENIEEITGSAKGMRDHCIRLLHEMDVLEIVGTGGDGANSFNISTTSSLVYVFGARITVTNTSSASLPVCGSTIWPYVMVWLSFFVISWPRNTFCARAIHPSPLIRTMAMPPGPGGVETAAMISSKLVAFIRGSSLWKNRGIPHGSHHFFRSITTFR